MLSIPRYYKLRDVELEAFCELLPLTGHRRPMSLGEVVLGCRSHNHREIITINSEQRQYSR